MRVIRTGHNDRIDTLPTDHLLKPLRPIPRQGTTPRSNHTLVVIIHPTRVAIAPRHQLSNISMLTQHSIHIHPSTMPDPSHRIPTTSTATHVSSFASSSHPCVNASASG